MNGGWQAPGFPPSLQGNVAAWQHPQGAPVAHQMPAPYMAHMIPQPNQPSTIPPAHQDHNHIGSRIEELKKLVAGTKPPAAAPLPEPSAPTISRTMHKDQLVDQLLRRTQQTSEAAHHNKSRQEDSRGAGKLRSKQSLVDELMKRSGNLDPSPQPPTQPSMLPAVHRAREQAPAAEMVDASARQKINELRMKQMRARQQLQQQQQQQQQQQARSSVPPVAPRLEQMKAMMAERSRMVQNLAKHKQREALEETIIGMAGKVERIIEKHEQQQAHKKRREQALANPKPAPVPVAAPPPAAAPTDWDHTAERWEKAAKEAPSAPKINGPTSPGGATQGTKNENEPSVSHRPLTGSQRPAYDSYDEEYDDYPTSDDSIFWSDSEGSEEDLPEDVAEKIRERDKVEDMLDHLKQPRQELSARSKLRVLFMAVRFPFAVMIPIRKRKEELDRDMKREAEMVLFMGEDKLGPWLSSLHTLTLNSLMQEKDLDLRIVPLETGLFGRVTKKDLEKRAMQARVRIKRVIHALQENVDTIPASVLGMLRYAVSLKVHFPEDYLFTSEKHCLERTDIQINEWSCTSDAAAQFLIIKIIFLRGLLFTVILEEKMTEGDRLRGANRERATRNLKIFGTMLYWLQIRVFDSEVRPLLEIGDWREVEATTGDLPQEEVLDDNNRYWWNMVTNETSWDQPEMPNVLERDSVAVEDLQGFLKDELLFQSTHEWMDEYAKDLAEWSAMVLQKVKDLDTADKDPEARKQYWHQEELYNDPERRRSSLPEEEPEEEADPTSTRSKVMWMGAKKSLFKKHGSLSPKRAGTFSRWKLVRESLCTRSTAGGMSRATTRVGRDSRRPSRNNFQDQSARSRRGSKASFKDGRRGSRNPYESRSRRGSKASFRDPNESTRSRQMANSPWEEDSDDVEDRPRRGSRNPYEGNRSRRGSKASFRDPNDSTRSRRMSNNPYKHDKSVDEERPRRGSRNPYNDDVNRSRRGSKASFRDPNESTRSRRMSNNPYKDETYDQVEDAEERPRRGSRNPYNEGNRSRRGSKASFRDPNDSTRSRRMSNNPYKDESHENSEEEERPRRGSRNPYNDDDGNRSRRGSKSSSRDPSRDMELDSPDHDQSTRSRKSPVESTRSRRGSKASFRNGDDSSRSRRRGRSGNDSTRSRRESRKTLWSDEVPGQRRSSIFEANMLRNSKDEEVPEGNDDRRESVVSNDSVVTDESKPLSEVEEEELEDEDDLTRGEMSLRPPTNASQRTDATISNVPGW
eukprot:TRINITY_DN2186_c0_g1_i2.p1 TRINITY_DN2186_c0_g1~~TRINITY_DN2186_c0_g1_i2.p1  ORF type:complete len:1255 (+),score=285.62 TRINITY_DN2186_c0_g1_i2:187-3951(+)